MLFSGKFDFFFFDNVNPPGAKRQSALILQTSISILLLISSKNEIW